ncbi:helix-turn-helix domain-containing protein [Neobacillus sp. YX16]|uniref:helix-turn-helix domain-containing protein n=1 Tax=Neobacillus sp. YX16 TaxID=3047874 RepID=UPI0024C32549|nr:helix-turn-helix domain-containing protein [Neobacillus sp. YX16]WHZ03391.1 helix-turn-helix domain-containing protein [Neobacillus sp. YX16]
MKINGDLKRARGNIPYSEIALKLNVSESTLYRWFRSKLSKAKEKEILDVIMKIKEG